jgi:hypothetical protein
MILITGATGNLGREVGDLLLDGRELPHAVLGPYPISQEFRPLPHPPVVQGGPDLRGEPVRVVGE